jgi:hypothetical protein
METTAAAQSERMERNLLRHVVLFSWKVGVPPEKIDEIVSVFCQLPERIGEIQGFEWGTDVSVEGLARGMSHCFLVTFKSAQDRDAYLPHPAHEDFVALIKPYLQDVLVFDYWQRS